MKKMIFEDPIIFESIKVNYFFQIGISLFTFKLENFIRQFIFRVRFINTPQSIVIVMNEYVIKIKIIVLY